MAIFYEEGSGGGGGGWGEVLGEGAVGEFWGYEEVEDDRFFGETESN